MAPDDAAQVPFGHTHCCPPIFGLQQTAPPAPVAAQQVPAGQHVMPFFFPQSKESSASCSGVQAPVPDGGVPESGGPC